MQSRGGNKQGPKQHVCDKENTIQPFNYVFNLPLGPIGYLLYTTGGGNYSRGK